MSENVRLRSHWRVFFEGFALALIAFVARALYLGHEPIHDELQHLLAARSWLTDGTFSVAGGEYSRGGLYTVVLATVYGAFDMSTMAARMVSVVFGSLWVVALFVWCRIRIGGPVAWIASLLFCFAPGAIFLSQYIRFYALHGLLFCLAAIATYELVENAKGRVARGLLIFLIVVLLGAAAHLQPITLIGTLGLALYVVIRLAPNLKTFVKDPRYRRWLWPSVAAAGIAGVVAVFLGVPQKLLETYLWAPLWSRGGGPLRYHWMLVGQYPLLWSLTPIAAIVVFARGIASGILCACVFCTAILIHSFAGMKAERFIYYAIPFFFVLSAILAIEIAPLVRRWIDSVAKGLVGVHRPRLQSVGRASMAAVAIGFLVFSNPAIRTTADILRGNADEGNASESHWSRYKTDWKSARTLLEPIVHDSAVVVTSQGLHLLHYFERLDVELSASRLSDLYVGDWDESREFTIDPRTGRAVISSAESFERVRECFSSGAVIVHDRAWGNQVFVGSEVAASIEAAATEVYEARAYGLRVFRWSTGEVVSESACSDLPVPSSFVAIAPSPESRP